MVIRANRDGDSRGVTGKVGGWSLYTEKGEDDSEKKGVEHASNGCSMAVLESFFLLGALRAAGTSVWYARVWT